MWDHRIVERICVLGDVEILLDFTPRIRKERPVGTHSAAIFIRLSDIVGANRDQSAIANLKFSVELNKPFSLPGSLGQKPPRLRMRTIGCCPCSSESFRR